MARQGLGPLVSVPLTLAAVVVIGFSAYTPQHSAKPSTSPHDQVLPTSTSSGRHLILGGTWEPKDPNNRPYITVTINGVSQNVKIQQGKFSWDGMISPYTGEKVVLKVNSNSYGRFFKGISATCRLVDSANPANPVNDAPRARDFDARVTATCKYPPRMHY